MLNLHHLSQVRWESNERSAGVQNDTSVFKLGNLIAKSNSVKVDLPVSLAAERNLDQLTSVVVFVDPTKSSLRAVALLVRIAKVEGKYWIIEKALFNHLVKGWDNPVNGDGIETKSKNTVKAAKGEGETWLVGGLCEILPLDLQITDLKGVLRDESAQATGSVFNSELTAVLLVR